MLLDPARPRVVLLARAIDATIRRAQLPLVGDPRRGRGRAPPPGWVNEAAADLYGFAPGTDRGCRSRARRFTIAGVWRDYGRPQGAVAIERERYVALTGDTTVTNGALWLAARRRPRRGARPRSRATFPAAIASTSHSPGEIRALSLGPSTARSR